jgi:hypothetical protein
MEEVWHRWDWQRLLAGATRPKERRIGCDGVRGEQFGMTVLKNEKEKHSVRIFVEDFHESKQTVSATQVTIQAFLQADKKV